MTFNDWWKECSGWYSEHDDSEGLAEWCLAKAAFDFQQARIDAHNARCDEDCETHTHFICANARESGGYCGVCPRRYRIEE